MAGVIIKNADTADIEHHQILKDYVIDLFNIMDEVGMTPFERDFIESMESRRTLLSISPKQRQLILDIAEKYGI